jgi:hypothetical protein
MCNNASTIEILDGSNFKRWKRDLEFAMGCANLDLSLSKDMPTEPADGTSTEEKESYEKWMHSNKMCMLAIKKTVPEHMLTGLPQTDSAKSLVAALEECYKLADNAEISSLLDTMNSLSYKDFPNVRDYIMRWTHMRSKLSAHDINLPDKFMVARILSTLPPEFGMIKTSFNTQGESWSILELITRCVAEEEKIKKEKKQTALATVSASFDKNKGKGSNQATKPRSNNFKKKGKPQKQSKEWQKNVKCFFCNKRGHVKKDCFKFKNWLEKKKGNNEKGMPSALVCVESNLADVCKNSWWIDSGASIHIAMSLKGFLKQRKPKDHEGKVKMGTDSEVAAEYIGSVKLILESGFKLELKNVLYIPSFRRNLISVSVLDKSGLCCVFKNGVMQLLSESNVIGTAVLSNGLYKLNLSSLNDESFVAKRALLNEESSTLWHKRLGHISKERLERLVKSGLLPSLDFDDMETCVDCIRGKLTKTRKKEAKRSDDLLQIIHTDICGPFQNTICGCRYFITFIDDLSRYGHIFLIKEKLEALEKFKVFKLEVENQLEKKIKIVRSDRGGEYYGKHGDTGQQMCPFAKFLQESAIAPQYTMPYSPEHHGVAERRNRTLMEMV